VSRRPHPYFGRLNRLEETRKPGPRRGRRTEPAASPDSEPGVLWDAFRETPEELADAG